MKVLLIGDNRDRNNWGCRATSMALAEVIETRGEVIGTIRGHEVAGERPVPWSGKVPVKISNAVDSMNRWEAVSSARDFVKKSLGLKDDFVVESASESVERFLELSPRVRRCREVLEAVDSCDAVIVNGEGSYIFSNPARRDTLYFNFILALGQARGKKTYVLNAMISDCPKTGRNQAVFDESLRVFESCDAISTRDPRSLEELKKAGFKGNANHFPDALFTWSRSVLDWSQSVVGELDRFEPFGSESFRRGPAFTFDQPYITLSGSSSAAWDQEKAFTAYHELAKSLMGLDLQLLVTPTCDGDKFLQRVADELKLPCLPVRTPIRLCAGILGKSSLFVSGRFHPAILASNGGTPCIFMGSNSHKTSSLQDMLEYQRPVEYSDVPNSDEIKEIVSDASAVLSNPDRETILNTARKRAEESVKVLELLN